MYQKLKVLSLLLSFTLVKPFRNHFRAPSLNNVRLFRTSAMFETNELSNSLRVTCESENDIEDLGSKLSQQLAIGDVLLMKGDLGAGKTTLSRGIIREKFNDPTMRVTSPSYLLDNTYEFCDGSIIHHIDLYRLPTACDLGMLGIPEIYSSSICLIEWSERMDPKFVPEQYLEIIINIIGESEEEGKSERLVTLIPNGDKWNARIKIMSLHFE